MGKYTTSSVFIPRYSTAPAKSICLLDMAILSIRIATVFRFARIGTPYRLETRVNSWRAFTNAEFP
jgi:hypothetical protein